MTETCLSGALMKGKSAAWCGLSSGCWNFWLMLLAMTSFKDVKRCWVEGGSAKTEDGRRSCDEGLRP